jgi:N-acetyl-anhydromuramyl-L-alanine amidase AmpD
VPQIYTVQSRADYRRAVWRPAHWSNYTNRSRGVKQIDMIIVHVAQGPYSGTINWFQYPRSNVSAHYVVGKKGQIAQCVHNEDIAWHAGNWRYNVRSIGIEHEGYAGKRKTWTDRMYRSSARLSAYLAKRYNIPVDRRHIIGHRQVPRVNSSCPGRYFDFDRYLRLIRRYR